MEINFLVQCRLKISMKISFREIERNSTRFNAVQQLSYAKNKFIGGSRRVISNVIEITQTKYI